MILDKDLYPMTEEMFIKYTGYKPENDDLERVNCRHAGKLDHCGCGWNHAKMKPMFFDRDEGILNFVRVVDGKYWDIEIHLKDNLVDPITRSDVESITSFPIRRMVRGYRYGYSVCVVLTLPFELDQRNVAEAYANFMDRMIEERRDMISDSFLLDYNHYLEEMRVIKKDNINEIPWYYTC